ncbi:alkyl hydroperoxide reductase subunit F [Companilactobacillus sp. RD055328]|uniref:alkyl hydroperoxide reductase subunit F n=1 Tax=Companilactobacillus sp. RD055328 TaxID=2916634 RepID=UPI0035CF028C
MLDDNLVVSLKQYLQLLKQDIVIVFSKDDSENSEKISEFINQVAQLSPKISIEEAKLKRTPSFAIKTKDQEKPKIFFAGIPLGHEFESFVLALLQVSGHEPKVSPEVKAQILNIDKDLEFETYASLTCTNCPDVVQALNIMSVINPRISHTMVEGGMNKQEVEDLNIMAVPTVYLNGEEWSDGRMTVEEIVNKISDNEVVNKVSKEMQKKFDVLIIGGGPAAATSAIYTARKGLRVGLVADRFGGQPLETLGIENITGTPYIEGEPFMKNIYAHMNQYPVHVAEGFKVENVEKNQEDDFEVTLDSEDVLTSESVIVATGAKWKKINIPGEIELKNKGVAYCPHCDGPLYKGKDVAVIGGGNSGVEAAIDLAGTSKHVTVLEYGSELMADKVLQDKLRSLDNVTIITSANTKEIHGTNKVQSFTYIDRTTDKEITIDIDGIFIQIGLVPNTQWLENTVELNEGKEIKVDHMNQTTIAGMFAAGDCTDVAYKQIVIAMGAGATAGLAAFDYLITK